MHLLDQADELQAGVVPADLQTFLQFLLFVLWQAFVPQSLQLFPKVFNLQFVVFHFIGIHDFADSPGFDDRNKLLS